MKLYSYYRSSASFRVRIALNLKGVRYTQIPVNLKLGAQLSDDYQSINPQRLLPALETSDGLLTQSFAIMAWLDEKFPERLLVLGDAEQRAKIRALAAILGCDTQPLQNLRVLKYLSSEIGVTEAQRLQWSQHWIRDGLSAFDAQLKEDAYSVGKVASLADICLIPQLYNARRFGIDVASEFKRLAEIECRCLSQEAFQRALPEQQPDYIPD
ncbi:maleylacetoacetate isomerase [uncultured Umboniibacter sp.]|uniref:maleylacetoacetate isomerase n=1 Tax=uncultured Umboniibacter sp. TaxID=1798917 RepID=UPI00260426CB|nr:maleylacetoacetate isomerase [uncultured Umboniibacter sp.]